MRHLLRPAAVARSGLRARPATGGTAPTGLAAELAGTRSDSAAGPRRRSCRRAFAPASTLDDAYAGLHQKLAVAAVAEGGVDQPAFPSAEYRHRRAKLFAALPPGGLLVLSTHPERQMSADVPYPYRGHTDVLYLAGYPEKDCVLLLHKPADSVTESEGLFAMLVAEADPAIELWCGAGLAAPPPPRGHTPPCQLPLRHCGGVYFVIA
eukprot:SAG22_NODE_1087_length_5605_cov_7.128224_4_plen_208_part_00